MLNDNKKEMAYDSFAIDAQKAKLDPRTGDLHLPVKAAKVGIMAYPEHGGIRRYFPAETLKAAVDSLAYASVTRLHPEEEEVTADNVKRVRKGFIKENPKFDGTYNRGDAIITDQALIDDILGRRLTEASAGYPFEADGKPGKNEFGEFDTTVTWISYNHVAVVPTGRAGADVRFEIDHKGEKKMATKERELREFKIGNDQLFPNVLIVYDPETSQVAIDAMYSREEKLMSVITELQTKNISLQAANDAGKESLATLQTAQDSMIPKKDIGALVARLAAVQAIGKKVGLSCDTETDPYKIEKDVLKKMQPKTYKNLVDRKQLDDANAIDGAFDAFSENIEFNTEVYNTKQALDNKTGADVPVFNPAPTQGIRSLEQLPR